MVRTINDMSILLIKKKKKFIKLDVFTLTVHNLPVAEDLADVLLGVHLASDKLLKVTIEFLIKIHAYNVICAMLCFKNPNTILLSSFLVSSRCFKSSFGIFYF